ncbi:putative efflux protein, MATE family [Cribrihabitans marinus]|uniref:Putative efflux protein, MATE family n=1 Tax=Cribrihabitans marinus TaxID=1227549 RepID=A0A1H6ZEE1_9RHOB|nr:MATE family efflux transporter [Cribrihabitans marinus]GGH31127.1 MATE family efflux transporter [Cribrihabitans marinus]SEJ49827.1 putative efflux protein, MATE family [Cribrihabitans marinus]
MTQPVDSNLTQGPIAGHFRALAIPAAVGMLFNTLYNVVDMFFAGLLSTSAQAGLALGFQAFYIAISAGVGLGAAMGAIVGNALGGGDRRAARRLAAQGLTCGVIAALVLMAAGAWYAPRIVELVSEPGPYRDAGIRYYLILSLALPGFLLAFACNGILQAHGDGRSMQRALVVAFFANIVLNPLMIYGIPGLWNGLGFDGLAASTVMSQGGVMVYMIAQVLRLRTMARLRARNFRPRAATVGEITLQALPVTVSLLVMFLSGFVVQYALKGFGEHAIAGFGIAIRLEQILLLPVLGVTQALLPIAAQNFGARDFDRVRDALFFCWKVGAIMTALAFPLLWLLGRPVLGLFTDDPDVLRVGLAYLRVESFILPAYMMLFAINSFLQALKRPIWTVWISLYRQGLGVALFVWVFVGLLGFSEIGVWLGIACAVLSGLGLALLLAGHVARREIGGLWRGPPPSARIVPDDPKPPVADHRP